MKREVYESQKAFAGEKRPSMQRRCVGHDYTERMMYMVTIVVEGRRALLGRVVGRGDAPADSKEAPRMKLSTIGQLVYEEWMAIPKHHPEISVVALQIMPDHLHGILFVKEKMKEPIGMALRGFKQKCNQHYRRLVLGVGFVALATQQTEPQSETQQTGLQSETQQTEPQSKAQTKLQSEQQIEAQQTEPQMERVKKDRRGEDRSHGLLFARGYNDKLLLRDGELQRWIDYLRDNPRRLLMKRMRPEWLRPFFNLKIGGHSYSGIGNRALLSAPKRKAVRISRRLTEEEIDKEVERYMEEARQGTILVSPAISPGEKRVMRAAFDAGLSTIVIMENGFTPLSKPHGEQFDACGRGVLLMLSPWEHHNEKRKVSAIQCSQMNLMALEICE